MAEQNTDVIQGTLDLLILKTVSLEPLHGFGIARRVEQISRGVFKVNPGSLLTALQRLERSGCLDAEWRTTDNSRRARLYFADASRQTTARSRDGRVDTPRDGHRTASEDRGINPWRSGVSCNAGFERCSIESAADRDIADEVQDYLEQATAAHVARGFSLDEARRAARMELGNPTAVREQVRGYGWENIVETVVADARYGVRSLRASPGFTLIAVLTLALGTGSTTAIFSAVNPILFEPLAYPAPDRIVMILETHADGSRNDGTFGMFRWLLERNQSFDTLAVLKRWQPTLTGAGEAERLDGQRVSAGFFDVLGEQPAFGRNFQSSDDGPGQPGVVILSETLWRRRFAGDPGILGRNITLDDSRYTVIGVMPESFENVLAPDAELWAPLQYRHHSGQRMGTSPAHGRQAARESARVRRPGKSTSWVRWR